MNVSRETQARLDIYLGLLKKWSPKINLVSPSTLKDAAKRHFEDSFQVAEVNLRGKEQWVDLGSGGGFPGAVVAILKAEDHPDVAFTLVESDRRKATFLRTVSRETDVAFNVLSERIERIEPLQADVLSARALASLDRLLEFSEMHLKTNGTAVFLKGETWKEELENAQKIWRFSWESRTSKTNPNAVILEIGDIARV